MGRRRVTAPKRGKNAPLCRSALRVPLTCHERTSLIRRRHEFCLSLVDMGYLFNVHWSTYRKWETGATHLLQRRHHLMVQEFISGRYNDFLDTQQELQTASAETSVDFLVSMMLADTALGILLRRICMLYKILEQDPKLLGIWRSDLEQSIETALNLHVATCKRREMTEASHGA